MKRAVFLLAALMICIVSAPAQNVVSDWFPVHNGDQWTYEHETRDFVAAGQPLAIHRWTTEETTVGSWSVPEGTLIARTIRIIEGAPPPGWVHPERDRLYLIRGDCVYGERSGWGVTGPSAFCGFS